MSHPSKTKLYGFDEFGQAYTDILLFAARTKIINVWIAAMRAPLRSWVIRYRNAMSAVTSAFPDTGHSPA
jgi:hypothetical protein